MDTLTHALSGVLLARATHRPDHELQRWERTLAVSTAAAFPDVDYALYWLDPLEFLNLHRGPTHSLLLLPLWAWLLATLLARLLGRRHRSRTWYWTCALGMTAHIAGDAITIYGTKLFYPLTDTPFALGISFDLNPYIAAATAVGVLATFAVRPLWAVSATLAVIAAYLLMQAMLKGQAIAVCKAYAHAQGLEQATIHAVPQPLSPFHWSLVVADHHRYRVAYLDLLHRGPAVLSRGASLLRRVAAGYRPEQTLDWVEHHRFGDTPAVRSLVRQAWGQQRFAPFRRFAELPALYRIDRKAGELCVWFTDLRHALPNLPPTFRYGLCRAAPGGDWRPYRLRYFSLDDRQPL